MKGRPVGVDDMVLGCGVSLPPASHQSPPSDNTAPIYEFREDGRGATTQGEHAQNPERYEERLSSLKRKNIPRMKPSLK